MLYATIKNGNRYRKNMVIAMAFVGLDNGALLGPLTISGIVNIVKLTKFNDRDYDAETGRWITKYSIGLNGGLNVYGYAGYLVNYFDPHGLDSQVTIW